MLQHRVLNGWPLFYLIALLTLGGMVAGMLIIGISSPEATVKLIRLSVQFASPWILIAFVTSALVTLFPGAISQWLLRNRRYTGLSFAAGFAWQAVFIAVLLIYTPPITGMSCIRPAILWGEALAMSFYWHYRYFILSSASKDEPRPMALATSDRYLVLLGGDLGELCRAGPESKCKDNRCCLCFFSVCWYLFCASLPILSPAV